MECNRFSENIKNRFDISIADNYEHENNDYAKRIARKIQEYAKQESHNSFNNSAK